MRDGKTRALDAMLRCRIVAPARANLVSRILNGAAEVKQITGARPIGESPQFAPPAIETLDGEIEKIRTIRQSSLTGRFSNRQLDRTQQPIGSERFRQKKNP